MRDHIIREIQRLAAQNGGKAPGNQAFVTATGIGEAKWRGKFWARWGDALLEAGFQPNEWNSRANTEQILVGMIAACRHYGRLPTKSELELLRPSVPETPLYSAVKRNIGGRAEVVAALAKYIGNEPQFADVLKMLPVVLSRPRPPSGSKPMDGHVYLIKSGDFYKIGRSDELERRVKEIRVALPDAATLIHAITTDDPAGIEGYWHRRFSDRRSNGEWFKLTSADVKAFVRRKFQ